MPYASTSDKQRIEAFIRRGSGLASMVQVIPLLSNLPMLLTKHCSTQWGIERITCFIDWLICITQLQRTICVQKFGLKLQFASLVFRPLSLLPAHSRLSRDNWKLFFLGTHFPSFSLILIVYRVLEAFSLNATLIFTLIIIIIIIIIIKSAPKTPHFAHKISKIFRG